MSKFLVKLWKAFLNSWNGFVYLLTERAFVQEIIVSVIIVAICVCSRIPSSKFLYIFSSYCLVLVTEAINTAIEAVVNRISTDKHPLSKKAKDIGSAAVFMAMLHFLVVVIFVLK